MKKNTRTTWVGLDVHKDTIAVCWLHADSQAEETREIPNEERAIRTLFKRLAGEGGRRLPHCEHLPCPSCKARSHQGPLGVQGGASTGLACRRQERLDPPDPV